ncbi:nucleoside triphosphate pyrophosphatase [Motiliproteus sp. MSK22-1]|uniref:Maf family protein n=1 Tax=Motiliproteus sp. MSK22-1 TaxID=1897630 RepID=UPI000976C5C0|nr:Maf family protein [Motiliproteus sp. MSK22-1]OMH30374.1 septum formation protein Maf [Motiliproteus sp. MSK22-1]
MSDLILASHSPRRGDLLNQIGVRFQSHGVDIDESVRSGESPAKYVERLALEKAEACRSQLGTIKAVLGSDTAVVCDQHILGKPRDMEHGVEMLMQLSGRGHQVMTSIALVVDERSLSQVVTTEVFFRTLSLDECQTYWATGEPLDKAGGYGIQGLAAIFIERIVGSYSAVVGLPLAETAGLLKQVGIPVWQPLG